MTIATPDHRNGPSTGVGGVAGSRSRRGELGAAVRASASVALTASAAVGLALGARSLVLPAPTGTSIDLLVAAAVLSIGALAAGVLMLGSLALLTAHLARSVGRTARTLERIAQGLTPLVLRRLVAAGVGASIGLLGPIGAAGAAEPDLGWEVTSIAAPASATPSAPEPTPERAPATAPIAFSSAPAPSAAAPSAAAPSAAAPSAAVATASASTPAPPGTVTVDPGDSLWSIAAEHLGTSAPGRIAQEWPRWYAANRETIGDDPDLIRPGQVLHAPTEAGELR